MEKKPFEMHGKADKNILSSESTLNSYILKIHKLIGYIWMKFSMLKLLFSTEKGKFARKTEKNKGKSICSSTYGKSDVFISFNSFGMHLLCGNDSISYWPSSRKLNQFKQNAVNNIFMFVCLFAFVWICIVISDMNMIPFPQSIFVLQ